MLEQLLPRPVSAAELPAPACGGSGFLCEYSERYKPLLKVGADPWEQVAGEGVQKAQGRQKGRGGNCVGKRGGPGHIPFIQIKCFPDGLGENEEVYGVAKALHKAPLGATLERKIARILGSGPRETCWQSRG